MGSVEYMESSKLDNRGTESTYDQPTGSHSATADCWSLWIRNGTLLLRYQMLWSPESVYCYGKKRVSCVNMAEVLSMFSYGCYYIVLSPDYVPYV